MAPKPTLQGHLALHDALQRLLQVRPLELRLQLQQLFLHLAQQVEQIVGGFGFKLLLREDAVLLWGRSQIREWTD